MYKIIICLFIRPFIRLLLLLWSEVATLEGFYRNSRLFRQTRVPHFNNDMVIILYYYFIYDVSPPHHPLNHRNLKLLFSNSFFETIANWRMAAFIDCFHVFSCILMNKINHEFFPDCLLNVNGTAYLFKTIWIDY